MDGILTKIRQGQLPEHAQKAVVQGIMPLETDDLVQAIWLICSGSDQFLGDARETFLGLPDGFKKTFFENKELDSDLIHFYLTGFTFPRQAMSAVLLNTATRATTICSVASTLDASLLDIVVNNQVKIQEDPGIVEALRANPALSINHKQKLDDYERLLLKDPISPAEDLEQLSIKQVEEEAIAHAREFVQVFGKEKESKRKSSLSVKREPEEKPKEKVSLLEGLANMTVPQKVQAAIKGDREARGILIRDANKLVCCAVIKSPRITESEVEFYSNLRNVQTDVLRLIAMNREWMKSYKIATNLVKNPRTPLTFSLKLLPRLNKQDMKNLIRDRGVPEALRTMARRISRGG